MDFSEKFGIYRAASTKEVPAEATSSLGNFKPQKILFLVAHFNSPPSCETIPLYLCSGFQKEIPDGPALEGRVSKLPILLDSPGYSMLPSSSSSYRSACGYSRLVIMHLLAVRQAPVRRKNSAVEKKNPVPY
jgi:hypothetical protein